MCSIYNTITKFSSLSPSREEPSARIGCLLSHAVVQTSPLRISATFPHFSSLVCIQEENPAAPLVEPECTMLVHSGSWSWFLTITQPLLGKLWQLPCARSELNGGILHLPVIDQLLWAWKLNMSSWKGLDRLSAIQSTRAPSTTACHAGGWSTFVSSASHLTSIQTLEGNILAPSMIKAYPAAILSSHKGYQLMHLSGTLSWSCSLWGVSSFQTEQTKSLSRCCPLKLF